MLTGYELEHTDPPNLVDEDSLATVHVADVKELSCSDCCRYRLCPAVTTAMNQLLRGWHTLETKGVQTILQSSNCVGYYL